MSAAIYIRWSTDDQGAGTTLAEQRESCLRWAVEHGEAIAPDHIFVDDGISGAKESRPSLNRLNQAIQEGAVSKVIVYKLDRLARSTYLAYKLVENDWNGRASLVSVTESHIDTTSTVGQLGFGIAAVFAAHERNTIRDRTLSGKRRRAAEGRNPGLRPPYGYRLSHKQFMTDEVERAVVQRIYADYLSGQTDGEIARLLNESGIHTRAGGRWHISAVRRVLTSPAYKGVLRYRDITAEDSFPVLVDAHTWEQAQAMRSEKAGLHPRRLAAESPYLLSGRLICAQCGRPMNGRVSRHGKRENRYYGCAGNLQYGDCSCPMVRQQVLEGGVVAHLLLLLDEGELVRRMAEQDEVELSLLQQEMSVLESRLRAIDRELARVRQDYRQGRMDAETMSELRQEIEADRAAVADHLDTRRSRWGAAQAWGGSGRAVSLAGAWAKLSHSQQRQVVRLLTSRILWDCHAQQLTIEAAV